MALPPELIRIKRRRDEEPVDSLFIHTENQQKRRRVTNFIFQRVTEEDGAGGVVPDSPKKQGITARPRRTVSSYARSEVPVVRATLPGEELLSGRQGVGSNPRNQSSAARNGAATSVLDTPEGEDGAPAAPFMTTRASSSTRPRDLSMFTRRFHLKKTTSTLPTSRAPTSGIQKRKKGQRPDIAVFVEKAREPKKQDSHLTAAHRGTDAHASLKVRSDGVPVVQLHLARPRKRPGTGTRAAVTKKGGGAGQGGRQDQHPIAEDLHRPTLQQPSTFQQALDAAARLDVRRAPASHPREPPTTAAPRTSRPPLSHPPTPGPSPASAAFPLAALALALTPPRAKTKVPPLDFANPYPYGPETMPGKDGRAEGDSGEEDEEEDDYVYDTYVRQATTHAVPASSEDVDGDVANRKVGIIVITHEDEKLWETYGVDAEGRDDGWDSEDEDENAEDFHANDYPDDELDSDDGAGIGAYRFRRNASDAEEFDEDAAGWSDEEVHPWNQRNPWACRGREVEDSEEDVGG